MSLPQKDSGYFSFVSLLLGVAAVATTLAYFGWKLYSEHQHNEKWKDYNDCGLA
ncbi:MAG: hypothetical protein K0R90_1441 [Oscillospiraceae bacterium]|nr:hypothetical protein [Oscillospiraceae bacterium]